MFSFWLSPPLPMPAAPATPRDTNVEEIKELYRSLM